MVGPWKASSKIAPHFVSLKQSTEQVLVIEKCFLWWHWQVTKNPNMYSTSTTHVGKKPNFENHTVKCREPGKKKGPCTWKSS